MHSFYDPINGASECLRMYYSPLKINKNGIWLIGNKIIGTSRDCTGQVDQPRHSSYYLPIIRDIRLHDLRSLIRVKILMDHESARDTHWIHRIYEKFLTGRFPTEYVISNV